MSTKNMRVALLGDVHANLPALEAVLSHAKNLGATQYWNIGDFVGYNAFPDQVVTRMRKQGFSNIIGNYDIKALNYPKKDKKWRRTKHPLKWLAFKWAYEHLSAESKAYLAALPEELYLTIGERKFLLVHGSPASNEELLDKATSQTRLMELKDIVEQKHNAVFAAIICGHSHQAFTRRVDNTLFVNTGSVGRPGDGNPRTAYAILDILDEKLRVSHYRLEYDLGRVITANRQAGLPVSFTDMILEGRDLDWVLGN
jgi:putative phosphoesterase